MMLGMSNPNGEAPSESEMATLRVSAAFARSVAKQLPLHFNSTLRAMRVANLEASDEYKKLQEVAGIEK